MGAAAGHAGIATAAPLPYSAAWQPQAVQVSSTQRSTLLVPQRPAALQLTGNPHVFVLSACPATFRALQRHTGDAARVLLQPAVCTVPCTGTPRRSQVHLQAYMQIWPMSLAQMHLGGKGCTKNNGSQQSNLHATLLCWLINWWLRQAQAMGPESAAEPPARSGS